jgi:hypothetical protein
MLLSQLRTPRSRRRGLLADDIGTASGVKTALRGSLTTTTVPLSLKGRGEGAVVKPAHLTDGRVQPGLKVRGHEYLRIIYGPDYTESLDVLRDRHLAKKRQLAHREHSLGMESLTAFVEHAPLWKVHQSVFAVLALESEPVDPRL